MFLYVHPVDDAFVHTLNSADCSQPDCHLHLHLRWADNPYVSGTVHTKDSAQGLIMGAGESPRQQRSSESLINIVDSLRPWSEHWEIPVSAKPTPGFLFTLHYDMDSKRE